MLFQKRKPGAQKLSEGLRSAIAGYIEAHYAEAILWTMETSRTMPDTLSLNDTCSAGEKPKPSQKLQSCAPMQSKFMSMMEMLEEADAGFTETLLQLIDKAGKKDSEIYKRAGLTKQHFSKIRNNFDYRPTKPTAIALALALELDLDQTRDLISRAGYALSNSSKFDLIIRYFIEHGTYDIVEINMALYEFDQPLLGS